MLSLVFCIAVLPAQAAQNSLTDKQKQTEILNMANNHRNKIPVELVLAVIRQEGGKGAFYTNSYAYNPYMYYKNSGPWGQPNKENRDGVMQVTKSSGFDKHKPYTQDKIGYDGAITDGCAYLNNQYIASQSSSLVYATLHYNTGPNSLYIYFNNMGDKIYLKNVATNLGGFVPNVYSIKNQNLVSSLIKGQEILDNYLNNKNIKPKQSPSYYKTYQRQLDAELKKI
jgi:hypothetical protein